MISIQAKGLGKAYNLYDKPIDALKELFLRRSYHKTFWAVRDLNLTLPSGSSLGIVGENGAGKTTLLQLLVGTISPTCGKVERNGRISAILELGTGFHPELSGLENIRLGCATLGLSPSETEKRLPEIIEFSELADFIERPVKTFSTGMYARLAFAVATSVEPDILVVDEALSVGDQHFQKKCADRMLEFKERGNTLVFCSHTMYFVEELCDQCLWLHNGRPEMIGPTKRVIERYQDYERSRDTETKKTSINKNKTLVEGKKSGGDTHLCEVKLDGDCHNGTIMTGETLKIRITASLSTEARAEGVDMGIVIVRNDMVECYGVSTSDEMNGSAMYQIAEDKYGICFVVEKLPLLAGLYSLNIGLFDSKGLHVYDFQKKALPFKVSHNTKEVGLTRIVHRWEKP